MGRWRPLLRFQLDSSLAQFLEQSRILDGNDGLRGEVADELNLFISEWPHFLTVYADCSDQLAFLEHRYNQQGSSTCELDDRLVGSFRSDIGDMDDLFFAGKTIKKERGAKRYDLVTLVSVNHGPWRVMHCNPAERI